ncbi:MAG: dTMP kinase [Acidobacteria bacterium]|nr:dTMP kinase [Acidobacteriota bacterium]
MKPLFITFEGLDGSGKSTHIAAAGLWFERRGLPAAVTKNPGGTRLGQCVRQAVLDPEAGHIDGRVEVLLMFADRRHNLLEVVEPALAEGRFVLCDRFSDSTRAYQGYGRGVPLEVIDRVDELATAHRRPDRTILFDVTPAEAQKRGQSSSRRQQEGGVDRIDAEDLAFYERVRKGYFELAESEPSRFARVDAMGSREETWQQVEALLERWVEEARSLDP